MSEKPLPWWPQSCLDELEEDLRGLTYNEMSVREILDALKAVNACPGPKTRPPHPAAAGRPEFFSEEQMESYPHGAQYRADHIRALQAYAETLEAELLDVNRLCDGYQKEAEGSRATVTEISNECAVKLVKATQDRDAFKAAHAAEHDRRAALQAELSALKAKAPAVETPLGEAVIAALDALSNVSDAMTQEELDACFEAYQKLGAASPAVETVNARMREALDYVQACFGAAITEGLYERLAETKDERLKDLLERRLLYGTLERMSAALASTPPQERT